MTRAAPPDSPQAEGSASFASRGMGAIGAAALVLMAANLTGSVLGFVRQAIVIRVFGENVGTDAFFAASVVPQMFYDLTIGAAISAALIPTFTEIYHKRGRDELARTAGAVLGLAWIVLLAVTTLLILFAQPLVAAILHSNHKHLGSSGISQAANILRYLLPTLFFLGTSAVLLSTLYSVRRFTVSAFAPSLYHLGVIGGALALARPLGVLALPIGAVAGSVGQAAIQLPAVMRRVGRLPLRLALTPDVRRILRLYVPVAVGLIVSLGGQVADLGFKWQLAAGGLTAMQVATTLTQFPIGLAVAAMSFAILPSISADAAFDRLEQFKHTLAIGMRLVLFLTVPAAVGYIVLATPIATIFQHGKVSSQATTWTAAALTGYAIQIPFVGIDQLLIFAFYARKNTITPMLVGVLGVGIYVGSALILLPRLQIFGLALANTIQNSLHGVILLIILSATIGRLHGAGLLAGLGKTALAGVFMGAVAGPLGAGLHARLHPHSLIATLGAVLLPIALGAGVYLAAARVLRSEELGMMMDIAMRRRPGLSTP